MAIRQVSDVPERRRTNKEPYCAADMREFVRRGMECAVLEYEGKSAQSTKACVEKYVSRHQDALRGVKACGRDGRCYVWREVTR